MNIILLITTIFFNDLYANGYIWPNDNDGSITTTFSEPRSRRFHAGIDIRTFGEVGGNIYAIDSGYVSRIKIQPNNYGKAIYLTLNDKNVVLYSHLSKFNPQIEKLVKSLHNKYQSSFFDHTLNKEEIIKLSKGEIIGYSGDTGSLSGPHIHFEIRNENGEPINPLINHYLIEDSVFPIAKSITFIPLNNKSWINGIQDYRKFKLKKIRSNKYVLKDTISTLGEFGIALETYDNIDNLPFKFGIYSIELFIDNILTYSVQFDKYKFKEDPLIYTEIDYLLLNEGNLSHRLFNSNPKRLSFIKTEENGIIRVDGNFHNFIIKISDANSNITEIQGVISGQMIQNTDINFYKNSNEQYIVETNNYIDNMYFNLQSRYNGVEKSRSIIEKIDDNKLVIKNFNDDLDILEYYIKNSNGIQSRKSFNALSKLEPYDIKGHFNIKHIDKGLIIEFEENVFSGYNPKLNILSNEGFNSYELYRKEKNLLSSNIINLNNIKTISLIYDSNPEIVFEKNIKTFNPKFDTDFHFKNYKIKLEENSFYEDVLLWIEEKEIEINDGELLKVSDPISIHPLTIPFKKEIEIIYKNINCNNCGFYKLNENKWNYVRTNYKDNMLITKITNGGIFCILSEKINPEIYNLSPSENSKYKQKDFQYISFNIDDNLSGIDEYSIKILIDNKEIFYDYIPYRKYVRSKLIPQQNIGSHSLDILVNDNVNNTINISREFIIIE